MNDLLQLEHEVLTKLLDGPEESLQVLRRQAANLQVCDRHMTGVGFYTRFSVPPEVPRLRHAPSFKLGDVNGTALNIKHGLGFLLYVTGGALSMLEGYTYDEGWPETIQSLYLSYAKIPRDIP